MRVGRHSMALALTFKLRGLYFPHHMDRVRSRQHSHRSLRAHTTSAVRQDLHDDQETLRRQPQPCIKPQDQVESRSEELIWIRATQGLLDQEDRLRPFEFHLELHPVEVAAVRELREQGPAAARPRGGADEGARRRSFHHEATGCDMAYEYCQVAAWSEGAVEGF